MKVNSFVNTALHPSRLLLTRLFLLLMMLVLFWVALLTSNRPPQQVETLALLFQSAEPTPIKPPTWVLSQEGGVRTTGPVTVMLPPGFTNQGGANVYMHLMLRDSGIPKPANVVPNTEFNVGIWPANDQVEYQKPIEIRLAINTAQVSIAQRRNLVMMTYNPEQKVWEPQPSRFDDATDQLITQIQRFTPVAKDFPEWGGRTFFCVLLRSEAAATTVTAPTVRQNANLRAGPGTNYAIVGSVPKGRTLQLAGQSADGRWYQLRSGEWIAAFLVTDAPALPIVKVGGSR